MTAPHNPLPPLPAPAYRGPLSGEPFWNSLQMREFRNAALNDAVAICRAVSVQELGGYNQRYQDGRAMGATVCANKIKELLK